MGCTERIEFAFAAFGEAGQAVHLAQGSNSIASAGKNLMRVTLMANIPDQPVIGGIEHRMNGHGEFDDAQSGAQMPAGDRHGIDCFRTQFIGKLLEVGIRQAPRIRRVGNCIKKWRIRHDDSQTHWATGPI